MILSNLMKPSEQKNESLKYYKSIDFLPIGCFNKITETGDLRYLLKLDDYEYLPESSLNLTETWDSICNEYIDFCKKEKKKIEVSFLIEKEITKLKLDYYYINMLIYIVGFDEKEREKYLQELRNIGIDIQYEDEEDLIKKLRIENKKTGQLKTKWKIKQKELERLNENENKNENIFDEILDSIETYKGYQINIWKISVKKWLILINNYNEYCKELKKHGSRKNK